MRAWRHAVACAVASAPTAALAHASQRAVVLTLPTGAFVWGAGLAVALTAAIASFLPVGRIFGTRTLGRWQAWPGEGAGSWVTAVLLLILVRAGWAGSHDPLSNPLPLSVWTVLWVGVPLVQLVVGDVWKGRDPWTGPVRAARALLHRTGSIGLTRLGCLPAVAGLLGFAWIEIVSLAPDNPRGLALVVALYWLAIFILAVAEGEAWIRQGEFMTVFLGFIARVSPFWVERAGRLREARAGLPGAQVLAMPALGYSAVAFVILMLSTVSFDGLHETFLWVAAIGQNPLDYPGRSAVVVPNSLGLVLTALVMAGLILGAVRLTLVFAGARRALGELIGPFALALLPIAAAYHVAHYLTALLTNGQYALVALSDPLARGDDLLGLGPHWVGFGFLARHDAVWHIWIAQFVLILGAHVVAVLIGRETLLRAGLRVGFWHEAPISVLMVLYTTFGLWMLSAPAIG